MGHKSNSISIEEIKKIEIGPNDILAIGLPKHTSSQQVDAIKQMISENLGDKSNKVLLYVGGIKFNTISFVGGQLVSSNNKQDTD